jgi:hypothetical protein
MTTIAVPTIGVVDEIEGHTVASEMMVNRSPPLVSEFLVVEAN